MAARKPLRLFVSPADGEWLVRWERITASKLMTEIASGYVESRHATQREAIAGARTVVARLPENVCSQIVVRGQKGQSRTEWVYGKDPFPARD